jgi:hypothetical protein
VLVITRATFRLAAMLTAYCKGRTGTLTAAGSPMEKHSFQQAPAESPLPPVNSEAVAARPSWHSEFQGMAHGGGIATKRTAMCGPFNAKCPTWSDAK